MAKLQYRRRSWLHSSVGQRLAADLDSASHGAILCARFLITPGVIVRTTIHRRALYHRLAIQQFDANEHAIARWRNEGAMHLDLEDRRAALAALHVAGLAVQVEP